MTVAPPRVAIAIPTLLGGAHLTSCLLSLGRQTWRDFEVIVIDNGLTFPQPARDFGFSLRILRPDTNIGYGRAINLAVKHTSAAMIAALNDDTEAEPQWLEELMREMGHGSRVGMCASSILIFDSGFLDSAGMSMCLDGSSKQRGRQMRPAAFGDSDNVLFPSGCAALYRREMLDEIGMFDDDFFLYCEDTDLGLRALWAGWECRYAAAAKVRHHYSQTAQPYSRLKAEYVERNRIWVALKSFPLPLLLAVPFASAARYICQLWLSFRGEGAAAQFVRSGHSPVSALFIVLRAHFATLMNLRILLRKRAMIAGTRRIGSVQFIRLIVRHRMTIRELARAC